MMVINTTCRRQQYPALAVPALPAGLEFFQKLHFLLLKLIFGDDSVLS